ncbi:MAG TPA: GNAT family N-acetyltransferase [Solirubrobacteraceae bacterium]|jgi:ribosomal protein S18 acetylase RimI-like enzyme|nr:GNAT family N-acetyltransferase [Solirubrobacteraceae bacterium]
MTNFAVVSVPTDRLDDLQPLWRVLYEHHMALTPHMRDRVRPYEQAWEEHQRLMEEWLTSESDSFVLAAQEVNRYVGYAFVRVRPGARFAVSWSASDPLAELAILAVLPEARGKGVGSALLDVVEARLRELQIDDMVIDVITTNTDAMRLYERRGALPFLTNFVQRVGAHGRLDHRGVLRIQMLGPQPDSSSSGVSYLYPCNVTKSTEHVGRGCDLGVLVVREP